MNGLHGEFEIDPSSLLQRWIPFFEVTQVFATDTHPPKDEADSGIASYLATSPTRIRTRFSSSA